MTISRRGFLGAILAATTAPAIVKVENISKIWVPSKKILTWEDYADGTLDATAFVQTQIDNNKYLIIPAGVYLLTNSLILSKSNHSIIGQGSKFIMDHKEPALKVSDSVENSSCINLWFEGKTKL